MRKLIACMMSTVMLAGCATRQPNVSLAEDDRAQYEIDLEECREKSILFPDIWETAAAGALLGASLVAIGISPTSLIGLPKKGPLSSGEWIALAGGVVVGATIGLVVSAVMRPTSGERLKRCLRMRGYEVSEVPWPSSEPEPAGPGI
jgi:hypothetical protein